MEGLNQVKEIPSEKDFMVKLDLQDTYFSIQLHRNSRKYVTFKWEYKFFEFRRPVSGWVHHREFLQNFPKQQYPGIPGQNGGNKSSELNIFCYV